MKITLEFDDKQSADRFMGWWLDGGGEQEAGFDTISWSLHYMRIGSLEENPCNFCGTPNAEFPEKKCDRTSICTNE